MLSGGNGADRLFGGTGNDLLRGGSGDDQLFGSSGRDMIYGDSGNDTLSGGSNADSFVFGFMAGDDIITDFSREDVLRLSRGLWGADQPANGAEVVADHAHIVSGDVGIDLGQGHSVTLDGLGSMSG
ncbi:MAG: peptidase, partial [Paracoccaceae bacterium]